MATPASELYFCSGVPLDPRYEHTLWFTDLAAQKSYFEGKVIKTFSPLTYLRKGKSVKVAANFETARTWDYMFTVNYEAVGSGEFNFPTIGKTHYYFVTDVQYVNDNTVEVLVELDVMQTYLFDFERLPCFVERMHTETDGVGDYTLDEGLELGHLVDVASYDSENTNQLSIMVLASINPNYSGTGSPVKALASMYNNVFSGLKVWTVDTDRWTEWEDKLAALEESGFLDGIHDMWMYPWALIQDTREDTEDVAFPVTSCTNADVTAPGRPVALDGYEPRNKKLLTYPYTFLYCSNNNGGSAVFRFERFTNDVDTETYFYLYGTVSPDASVILAPRYYNGQAVNKEECLALTNYPHCAWDSDTYKMWLAQNQNQHHLTQGTATIKAVGGALAAVGGLGMAAFGGVGGLGAAAGGVATAVSGYMDIQNLMAQKRDMEIQPPQARGTFSSTANITAGKHNFTFYVKTINAEAARCIDDYFTMYGYKLNRVMVPQIHCREAFTYVKTIGCHIKADFAANDVMKIEAIFDKGITFWADPAKVGDYYQDNDPLN